MKRLSLNSLIVVALAFTADYCWPPLFKVHQTISAPSGARLIAVTSNVAFGYMEIAISGAELNVRNNGFAIANIRAAN